MKVLVTGGAGFIGSAVIRHLIAETDWHVVNVDKLTYAGSLASLAMVADNPRYRFHRLDICDQTGIGALLEVEQPDAIMHLAAETHVDRAIESPGEFVQTNVAGTFSLLDQARRYWQALAGARKDAFRFHHISTDEVFGALGPEGKFHETSPYLPNSPYAASKAGADHLVRAWFHTYGLSTITTNCSNNYGPYQFPEKLIPQMIVRALAGQNLPLYGKGENVRDWLYVEDHARALVLVLIKGRPGRSYNIGGNSERRNIDVVRSLCALLDREIPRAQGGYSDLITFVADRLGHDARYAIDTSRITAELGWAPAEHFESGLEKTVRWYLQNRPWWQRFASGETKAGAASLMPRSA